MFVLRVACCVLREREVGPSAGSNFFNEKIDEAFVEIIAAKARVAVRGKDLENAVVKFEDRKIECAAAKIIDGDFGALLEFIEAVGQRRSGRFVDDAFDGESG